VPERPTAEELDMQSFYTSTVVNQIIDERVDDAARARRSTGRRRRIFGRGQRRGTPLSPAPGPLHVTGASK
jgi:hypothetical protein